MPYIVDMDVVTGTDTSQASLGVDRLLAGIRRLTALADEAGDAETMFRALAGELLAVPGADEVHVHHLVEGDDEQELVVVYMFEGTGRLSYLLPRRERPPGVSWVANTRRSFLAADPEELDSEHPAPGGDGAGELRAAAAAYRAGRGRGGGGARAQGRFRAARRIDGGAGGGARRSGSHGARVDAGSR